LESFGRASSGQTCVAVLESEREVGKEVQAEPGGRGEGTKKSPAGRGGVSESGNNRGNADKRNVKGKTKAQSGTCAARLSYAKGGSFFPRACLEGEAEYARTEGKVGNAV